MTDHVDPTRRSRNMAAIHSKATKPEMELRRIVRELGYRFGTNCKTVAGKPDLVFASRRKVIFVHGCFWHRHKGCKRASTPSTRIQFWESKFSSNVRRDKKVQRELRRTGWSVLVVWQCQLKNQKRLKERLNGFLKE